MSQSQPRGHQPSRTTAGASEASDESCEATLAPDEMFHLLQTNRRRDALRYLDQHDGPVRMRDLAEQVAAWENDITVRELTSKQRQRVYIPLYQTHLPKLDDAGVIEYNQSRGIVERTPLADQFEPYLDGLDGAADAPDGTASPGDHVEPRDRNWLGYYTNASGIGILLFGGTVLGLPVFSKLSGILIGAVISLMFGLLSLARYLDSVIDGGGPVP